MDPWYSHETQYPSYVRGSYVNHHSFDQHPCDPTYRNTPQDPIATMLPMQCVTVWDVQGGLRQTPMTFSMLSPIDPMSSWSSEDGYSIARAPPMTIYPVQPQPARPSYMEAAIQTSDLDTVAGTEAEDAEKSPACGGPAKRRLVPQKAFKPARQRKEPWDLRIIKFSVHGEEGICLSDALRENWLGFDDRDERPLPEDGRFQIMIRLHFAGCSPWESKACTTDYTKKRRPITRMKLAREVAKAVERFIARERANGHNGDPSCCDWKDTLLKNMYLTRLVRVSTASWQPEIFVELPPAAALPSPSPSSSCIVGPRAMIPAHEI